MFKIDDLWKILNYLKDGTADPDLHQLTRTLATSEKEIVSSFFENVLDQTSFSSEDYRRLRGFLIDWYASLRTIVTTQKEASKDAYAIPDDHLSELFRSFGFTIGLNLVPLTTKANLFLDLVDFYKRKGTPETLGDVLDYYGFSETDLIEYWLLLDDFGTPVFRGESVRLAAAGSTILLDTDVSFDRMTEDDPHWMLTENRILTLVQQNKINLPSKTPYFSLSSIFYLHKTISALAIMNRVVQDQYDRWDNGLSLPQNVAVKNLGEVVSLLEAYLAAIYIFEKIFGYVDPTLSVNHLCYDGTVEYISDPPVPVNLETLAAAFAIDTGTILTGRDDRDSKLASFNDTWTRPISQSFLGSAPGLAEGLLQSINPVLKDICDSWVTSGDQSFLITYLLGTLDIWVRLNVDSQVPSLTITTLGLGFRSEVESIVNFFKPYRARLAFIDTSFSIQDRLRESFLIDFHQYMTVRQDATSIFATPSESLEQIVTQYLRSGITLGCAPSGWDTYDDIGVYDTVHYVCDELDATLIQTHTSDPVIITDDIDQTIVVDPLEEEYPRGLGGPMMFDMGNDFDELVPNPIVEDYVDIQVTDYIVELPPVAPDYIRGPQGPTMFDIGNEFDQEVQAPVVDDSVDITVIGP